MIPGPTLILACPSCGALHQLKTLRSGNTFGALLWTDGKVDAPRLPAIPQITCCHQCEGFFWLRNAREVGEFERSPWNRLEAFLLGPGALSRGQMRQWKAAPQVTHLGEEQLLTALKGTLAENSVDWQHLRVRAWWASNDPFRRPDMTWRPWSSRSSEAQENVRALAGMLAEGDSQERLMKAELLRERQCFDEALTLLRWPFAEKVSGFANFVRELATQEISELRPLPQER